MRKQPHHNRTESSFPPTQDNTSNVPAFVVEEKKPVDNNELMNEASLMNFIRISSARHLKIQQLLKDHFTGRTKSILK